MIALDSSVWIEMWKRADTADRVISTIVEHGGDPGRIVVPATVVLECFRWLLRNVDDDRRIAVLANGLDQHDHVALDASLARRAAVTLVATGLAHADATILAAARSRHATLLTFDSDFAGIPDAVVLTP